MISDMILRWIHWQTEIAPPIVETTTALPYVYTTVKPRSRGKQHQGHKSKVSGGGANSGNGHDGQMPGRGRGGGGGDASGGSDGASIGGGGAPNHIQENEIVGGIGSAEGESRTSR